MSPEELIQLKTDVEQIKDAMTFLGMSFDMKEIIRNEVIKGEDSQQALTRIIPTPAGGSDLTLSVNPVSTLVLKFRGREYGLPVIYIK